MVRKVAAFLLGCVLAASSAYAQFTSTTARRFSTVTFAQLGAPLAGSVYYCSDCNAAAPCTSGGSGSFAFRVGSSWNCTSGGSGITVPGSTTSGNVATWGDSVGGSLLSSAVSAGPTGTLGGVTTFNLRSTGHSLIRLTTDDTGLVISDIENSGFGMTLDLTGYGSNHIVALPNADGRIVLCCTSTNDNAGTGFPGEYVTGTTAANTTSLSTGTTANVGTNTNIILTAGDWDCTGAVNFTFGSTTSITNLAGGISTTTGTLPAQDSYFDYETPAIVPTGAAVATWVVPTVRLSLSGSTSVFLVSQATFTVSTIKVGGTIRCRRMR